MTAAAAPTKGERTFFGQPRGLAYLAFTEAWERLSFYGMGALLVLYMTQQLLLPGHVENVVGFAAFRAAIESAFGPMTTVAIASQINGLSTMMGIVFLTLFVGGTVAGRLGSLYEPLGPAAFFALHAGISAVGALLATVLAGPLERTIRAAQSEQPRRS